MAIPAHGCSELTKYSHIWFHRFSGRNGGDLAQEAAENREAILSMWEQRLTKRQIAERLGIHMNTVKAVCYKARKAGDPRAFAGVKPLMQAQCTTVIELQNQQWFIRGLADKLEIHYTQAESLIRHVVSEVEQKQNAHSKVE